MRFLPLLAIAALVPSTANAAIYEVIIPGRVTNRSGNYLNFGTTQGPATMTLKFERSGDQIRMLDSSWDYTFSIDHSSLYGKLDPIRTFGSAYSDWHTLRESAPGSQYELVSNFHAAAYMKLRGMPVLIFDEPAHHQIRVRDFKPDQTGVRRRRIPICELRHIFRKRPVQEKQKHQG